MATGKDNLYFDITADNLADILVQFSIFFPSEKLSLSSSELTRVSFEPRQQFILSFIFIFVLAQEKNCELFKSTDNLQGIP